MWYGLEIAFGLVSFMFVSSKTIPFSKKLIKNNKNDQIMVGLIILLKNIAQKHPHCLPLIDVDEMPIPSPLNPGAHTLSLLHY
jgi:hypothetical protein